MSAPNRIRSSPRIASPTRANRCGASAFVALARRARRAARRLRDRAAERATSAVAPPPPAAPPMPRNAEPPPPPINLSGFPLPYRQGYADGCASATGAERKDAARFGRRPQLSHGLAGRPRAVPQEIAATARSRRRRISSTCAACAITCSTWGDPRRAAARAAARLDGRRRVVPVPGRRARGRLARDRARPARLRPLRVAAAGLLVPRLRRRSRRAARRASRPTSRCASSATASAATSSMHYAGVRPARVRASCRSTASAFPAEAADDAPRKLAEVARCAARSAALSRRTPISPPSPTACRRTIRACRATRRSSSRAHWARGAARRPRGAACPIRATSCRFRTVYRMEEIYRGLAQHHGARAVGRGRRESHIPRWLDAPPGRRDRHRRARRRARAACARSRRTPRDDRRTPATCCITTSPPRSPR